MCQVGIASVRLTHALSFGLQVVVRDLQFLHEIFDIGNGRCSGSQGVSADDTTGSAGLLPRTRARMPPSSISIVASDDFDFATSIGFPILRSASQPTLSYRGKGMLIIRYLSTSSCRFRFHQRSQQDRNGTNPTSRTQLGRWSSGLI